MKILLVEDEKSLAAATAELLKQNFYAVDVAYDGQDGFDYGATGLYDLIILDIMLPKQDGLTVLSRLRSQGIQVPVLFLTAKSELEDRIRGLDTGADDYLAKPFAMGELMARIRALTRRKGEFLGDVLACGVLTLDKNSCELICKDRRVSLGAKEYQIMELLLSNQKQVITKELFVEKIWGYDCDSEYNNVEVYISFLRKKIAYLESPVAIKTIRGRGYTLNQEAS